MTPFLLETCHIDGGCSVVRRLAVPALVMYVRCGWVAYGMLCNRPYISADTWRWIGCDRLQSHTHVQRARVSLTICQVYFYSFMLMSYMSNDNAIPAIVAP